MHAAAKPLSRRGNALNRPVATPNCNASWSPPRLAPTGRASSRRQMTRPPASGTPERQGDRDLAA